MGLTNFFSPYLLRYGQSGRIGTMGIEASSEMEGERDEEPRRKDTTRERERERERAKSKIGRPPSKESGSLKVCPTIFGTFR